MIVTWLRQEPMGARDHNSDTRQEPENRAARRGPAHRGPVWEMIGQEKGDHSLLFIMRIFIEIIILRTIYL